MAAGDKAFWSDLANAVNPPIVKLVQQATQLISAAVALTFGAGSEEIDTHNFHDPATNPSRITPTVPGTYRVTATLNMQAGTYSSLLMVFRKNGANTTPLVTYRPDPASATAAAQLTTLLTANGTTDYFEIIVQTTPAGTTSIASGGVQASTFECEYKRP
jgi:hypothetical protein